MNFEYEETAFGDDALSIKTNQGVLIRVVFCGLGDTLIIDDYDEIDVSRETIHGLFVGIGDKIFTLADVYHSAVDKLSGIKGEIEREKKLEERHEREMSHSSRYI